MVFRIAKAESGANYAPLFNRIMSINEPSELDSNSHPMNACWPLPATPVGMALSALAGPSQSPGYVEISTVFFASPRPVWLLGLVSFCNDAASELVYPLAPIYLASVLMAGPPALGIIESIAEATGSLLKLFSGMLSDRMRSIKPLLLQTWVFRGN